ncbi:MAG TPA: PAS domain-containing sensor histidine kinase [Thermoanaerobaculia bacterium]|nr:PAS domain-containing sensor histidine kinase [Thermoanaerobaculia bacterium]
MAVAILTAAKAAIPGLQPGQSFVLYFLAIAASAWFGGRTGGFAAIGMVAVVALTFAARQDAIDAGLVIRIVVFALECIGINLLIHVLQRQREELLTVNARLDHSRALLNNLIDNVPTAVLAFEPDGSIWIFNRAAEEISGYTRAELSGKQLAEVLIPPEWREKVLRHFRDPLSTEFTYPLRSPWIRKSGEQRLMEWRCAPLASSDGLRILAIGVDVTEIQRVEDVRESLMGAERAARQAAEEANLAKDRFLGTISHELRAPLTSILGWAQLLIMSGRDDHEMLAQGLAAIETNARAQATLIEDLLDYTRLATGKVKLEQNRVRVADIVRSTVEAFLPEAQKKRIEIRSTISDEQACVNGDERRLRQVFMNILQNAVRYTDEGHIDIEARQVGSELAVSIRDTGRGINPEFLPRIFERFTQESANEGPGIAGLGIGLALVKDLVTLHGGRVEAMSEGPGRGSTFAVYLPVTPPETPPTRSARDAAYPVRT